MITLPRNLPYVTAMPKRILAIPELLAGTRWIAGRVLPELLAYFAIFYFIPLCLTMIWLVSILDSISENQLSGATLKGHLYGFVIPIFLFTTLRDFLSPSLTLVLCGETFNGRHPSFLSSIRDALRFLPRMLWTLITACFFTLVYLFLLVVPGLFRLLLYSFCFEAAFFNQTSGSAALDFSEALVRPRWRLVLGRLFSMWVLVAIPSLIGSIFKKLFLEETFGLLTYFLINLIAIFLAFALSSFNDILRFTYFANLTH